MQTIPRRFHGLATISNLKTFIVADGVLLYTRRRNSYSFLLRFPRGWRWNSETESFSDHCYCASQFTDEGRGSSKQPCRWLLSLQGSSCIAALWSEGLPLLPLNPGPVIVIVNSCPSINDRKANAITTEMVEFRAQHTCCVVTTCHPRGCGSAWETLVRAALVHTQWGPGRGWRVKCSYIFYKNLRSENSKSSTRWKKLNH